MSAPNVTVVGMHRSGTSAIANTVFELGPALPDATELIGKGPYNEKGHWESRDLARFDESLLRYLGGTWSAPPCPKPGWETSDEPALVDLYERARELASRCFSRPPVVLKDPRLCITLPLWREVLTPEPCAVLIVRDPVSVARSLRVRDGFPLTLGLALWARYVRQAMTSLTGLPVFAVEYGSMFADSRRRVGELADFLVSCGVDVHPDGIERATNVFEEDLRHHEDDGGDCPAYHVELLDALQRTYGCHERWSAPVLPDEPPWIADTVWMAAAGEAVTARLEVAQTELKWIKRSRLFRTARTFWRATGTGPVLSDPPDGTSSPDPDATAG
jgi:hypothetical protein